MTKKQLKEMIWKVIKEETTNPFENSVIPKITTEFKHDKFLRQFRFIPKDNTDSTLKKIKTELYLFGYEIKRASRSNHEYVWFY